MKLHRKLVLLLIFPALGGCTPAIEVRLAFADGLPVLTFYAKGLFPRRLETICLWNAEIIDEASGKAALQLFPLDYERSCAAVSEAAFNRPEQGLRVHSPNGGLVRGRTYYAEVIADEGMGKSKAWIQP